jgi:hypothetical protein
MFNLRRRFGLMVTILALVAVATFTPRLHLPHTTPKWRAAQGTDLNYNCWFAVDARVDRDAAICQEHAFSAFAEIVLSSALQSTQSSYYSSALVPHERRLFWPLRRLPSSADNEDPTV